MLYKTSKRSENRALRLQRLQQDLEEMEKLHDLAHSAIRFIAEGKVSSAPDFYSVELSIKSFIDITSYGVPIDCNRFKMEICLPSGYPKQNPECKVYPAPFHPHFKRFTRFGSRGYGMWIKPHNQDEGLGSLVLRIVRSLQFEPSFIDINETTIGNQEALEWYSYWISFFNQNVRSWFPTDKTDLPDTLSSSHKRFDFELNGGSSRGQRGNRFAVTTRKAFQIIDSTPPYEPAIATLPEHRELYPSDFRGAGDTVRLYIQNRAMSEIFKHISWGKVVPENQVEQGGILLGHAYRDEVSGTTFGIVDDAIAGNSATGTSTYLEMGHATWKKMIDQVDAMLVPNSGREVQIIGWYHTHPNQLDVFMSGTDTGTQKRFFCNDWQFAIVLNPHRKMWRAFHGKNAEECRGYVSTDS